jgi:hypothetical protein
VIARSLAPHAVQRLGEIAVLRLCGVRPIVAMFIAHELERRADAGVLEASGVGELRQGDLVGWLRKRLHEDHLLVERSDGLLPTVPELGVVGAAAALAAPPLSNVALFGVVPATLEAVAPGRDPAAEYLIGVLESLGWLDRWGDQLTAAHDVVADEVLEDVLWERPAPAVRLHILEGVLQGARRRPRVLARFAVSLDRVLSVQSSGPSFHESLQAGCEAWMARHAVELGQLLATAPPDESSFALGAVIAGPPWAECALNHWEFLVTPWLVAHGRDPEARHLLYSGLRFLSPDAVASLIAPSVAWLGEHASGIDASFVLGPLLKLPNLGEHTAEALKHAMAWLDRFGTEPDAGFVLPPLLGRTDLEAHAPAALKHAMASLDRFGAEPDAGFVLDPLLGRTDLGAHAPEAITHAMAWLDRFGAELDAEFVLGPLLGRTDLEAHAPAALKHAMAWLDRFGAELGAGFVLAALLGRRDLVSEVASEATGCALGWLEEHGDTQDADFVLREILVRPDLSSNALDRCARRALTRLERTGLPPEASYLLRWCLAARGFPADELPRLLRLSLAWMEKHPNHRDLDYVFKRLLRRPNLSDTEWQQVAVIALQWLKRTPHRKDRDHALNSLLVRPDLMTASERSFVAADAIHWLQTQELSAGVALRLVSNLRNAELSQDESAAIAAVAARDELPVSARLHDWAGTAGYQPDVSSLQQAVAAATDRLQSGHPASAGYYLSALLPLSWRLGDANLQMVVKDLAKQVAAHPQLSSKQRYGFATACYRLLDDGAWPAPREGEAVLCEVGLARPPEHPQPQ